jgi:hypothetical protein
MSRDRIVISVLIAVGILGGSWFGLLGPKRQEAQRLGAKLATQQQRLAKAQAGAADATTARDRYNADYSTVALLGKAVPSSDGMSSLLYQIDSAAGDSKIDFRSLTNGGGAAGATGSAATPATPSSSGASTSAAAATGATAPTPLPLSLIFSGSFMDMQRLLGRVDRFVRIDGDDIRVSGRLLSIDDIALSASPGGLANVEATITATAYTMPASTEPTAAAGQTPAAPAAPGSTATASASSASPTATASVGGAQP